MSKIRLTMIAVLAGLFLTFASGAAQAQDKYPVATPTPTPAVLSEDESQPANAVSPAKVASDSSNLPNTGGPNLAIIVAGIAFVAVGATVVVASRRRTTH